MIDDESDAREMPARGLRKFGARLSTAASAEEGQLALQTGEFSLVICDIGMSGMNGFDFMNHWRTQEKKPLRPSIPAVALTAYASAAACRYPRKEDF